MNTVFEKVQPSHTAIVQSPDGEGLDDVASWVNKQDIFVFDFDGTLADSEVLHLAAYNMVLAKAKVSLSSLDFEKYKGNDERSIYRMIEDRYSISLPFDEVRDSRLACFMELVSSTALEPFSYVRPLLTLLSSKKVQIVILSSQLSTIVSNILAEWSIIGHFSAILTPDLFGEKKLNLLASLPNRFGRNTSNFIVFEDSVPFLKEANSMGMRGYLVTASD